MRLLTRACLTQELIFHVCSTCLESFKAYEPRMHKRIHPVLAQKPSTYVWEQVIGDYYVLYHNDKAPFHGVNKSKTRWASPPACDIMKRCHQPSTTGLSRSGDQQSADLRNLTEKDSTVSIPGLEPPGLKHYDLSSQTPF